MKKTNQEIKLVPQNEILDNNINPTNSNFFNFYKNTSLLNFLKLAYFIKFYPHFKTYVKCTESEMQLRIKAKEEHEKMEAEAMDF